MKKVAVIGGGPSGMIAAYFAAKKNNVELFEQNEKLGKKLYITGKGRCNITNDKDISEFFDEISRNEKFLYSAFYSFTNRDLISLLKENGLDTIVERGGRVFPKSQKSSDVIKTYEKMLKKNAVKVHLNHKITNIAKKDDIFTLNDTMEFDSVIIATGGYSYRSTGSTGDGYKFAKHFGIKVEELRPALVPVELEDDFLDRLSGLTLKNIELIAKSGKKEIHREFGELLFAHFGISGPVALRMSNIINRKENINLFIDLKPALDQKTLDDRILRDFHEFTNKNIDNGLTKLLPKNLIPVVLELSDIDPQKTINEITKEERLSLVKTIKNMPLKYKSLMDINASIVTSGGISTEEINPSTMQSLKIPNLYFCGEVIDVEGFTGGFNLQIANSTGYLAGISV
ncbi:putative flavoprotein [Peptoniphilus sp. ING2-D1G]|nr:putative flavoprotein [Peptoniphilus sp. ING2-D1G]